MASVEKELLGMLNQTAEPLKEFNLKPGEEYEVTVVASNAIGNSSESNSVLFTAPNVSSTTTSISIITTSTPSTTDTTSNYLLYIPILVVGVAIVIVVLLIVAASIASYRYKSECFLRVHT